MRFFASLFFIIVVTISLGVILLFVIFVFVFCALYSSNSFGFLFLFIVVDAHNWLRGLSGNALKKNSYSIIRAIGLKYFSLFWISGCGCHSWRG